MERKLKALHVIEKKSDKDRKLTEINKSQNLWETGDWNITEKRAKQLIGSKIYVHKGQKKPSHKGGQVTSFRMTKTGRYVFTFVAHENCDNVIASANWGNELCFVWEPLEGEVPNSLEPMLFVYVGWMDNYRGQKSDKLLNGGSYAEKNHRGVEVCNFKSHKGKVYGNFGSKNGISAKGFKKLGGSSSVRAVKGTIVWIAKNEETNKIVVIGWYQNAEIFRAKQKLSNPSTAHQKYGLNAYYFSAKKADACLLESNDRILEVPKGKGGKGKNFLWYADSEIGQSFKKKVIDFIQSYLKAGETPTHSPGWRNTKCDPERNKVVEQSAVDFVSSYFESGGFTIKSVEADNVGYDLEAVRGSETFYIEVKGLSGSRIQVGISPNEYDFFKECRANYYLAIVSDALTVSPILTLCKVSKDTGQWIVEGKEESSVITTEKTAAIINIS